MGGGGEKKKTNSMIDQQYQQNQADQSKYMGAVNTGLSGAQERANDMYGVQFKGFNNFADGGGNYDPSKYGSSGGGGGGAPGLDSRFGDVENSYRNFMSGGGIDTGSFNRFQGELGDISRTGGWSPERIGSIDKNLGMFRDIAKSGGVDAEGQARMRGNGVFDEYAKTGGLDDTARQNIRQRATSVIPSYYSSMRDETNRMANVQGGYGPGRSALMGRMGRDQAAAAQDAALSAELGITDKVNQGRQWGAGNLASSEGALQSLMSGNKLSALNSGSNVESNMVNSIAQNRTGAANAGAGNEVGMQGNIQRGKMFGTSGLEGMAESAASRAAAASNASAADARWRAQFDREGQQYGLEGMQSLYGMAPGEVNMYLNANNAGRNTNANVAGQAIDQRMSNNPQRDWLGTIMGAAGAAGGLMTGVGNMGFGRARAPMSGGR